jgi:YidC/Oxa1 family membrane protein insertase
MANFYNSIYNILGVVFGPIMSFIYDFTNNYGVAIILFTVFCRLLMLPSAFSQQKGQAKNARMQFKMRKIQERYKDDRQRLQQEQQEFYKREGYNPMSAGCSGGMLLQFPIIFGLISAIYRPLKYAVRVPQAVLDLLQEKAPQILVDAGVEKTVQAGATYLQLRIVQHIQLFKGLDLVQNGMDWFAKIQEFAQSFKFLGLDLGTTPNESKGIYYLIPVLAGVSSMLTSLYTFFRQRRTNPGEKQNMAMMGCTVLGMPLFSAFISLSFPVGIGIYWVVSSLAAFVQVVILSYTHPPQKMLAKVLVEETIQRRSRENSRKKIAAMD